MQVKGHNSMVNGHRGTADNPNDPNEYAKFGWNTFIHCQAAVKSKFFDE